MSANPVANPSQFAAEAEVRAMWEQTQTRAAKAHCAQLWRIAHGPEVPPGIDHLFDPAMDACATTRAQLLVERLPDERMRELI